MYRRLLQGYLATTGVAGETIGRLGLDDKSEDRARFVVGQVTDALAPTNTEIGRASCRERV